MRHMRERITDGRSVAVAAHADARPQEKYTAAANRSSGGSCRSRLAAPLGTNQRIQHVIHEMVVEPLGLAHDAFCAETQPLGHGAASFVPDGHWDRDPVEIQVLKRMANQSGYAACHDASSLRFGGQPIADFAYPVERFDPV